MVEVHISKQQVEQWLNEIPDPEIPVVSIRDLGIVRGVEYDSVLQKATVTITPTYTGCPAMDMIAMNIRMALLGRRIKSVEIILQISPAWTTDWISEDGKKKMKLYGIAPPQRKASNPLGLFESDEVPCPRCNSISTTLISNFGATSCKSMYRCDQCKEPFEHFKCH
jgi:ring-1,2-phenylacetyl-CoA epoxidase subunit PaaD